MVSYVKTILTLSLFSPYFFGHFFVLEIVDTPSTFALWFTLRFTEVGFVDEFLWWWGVVSVDMSFIELHTYIFMTAFEIIFCSVPGNNACGATMLQCYEIEGKNKEGKKMKNVSHGKQPALPDICFPIFFAPGYCFQKSFIVPAVGNNVHTCFFGEPHSFPGNSLFMPWAKIGYLTVEHNYCFP